MKKIRLNESELVSLVKTIIMESTEKLDFWQTLSNYSGQNQTIIDIGNKSKRGDLTPKQKSYVYDLLKKEFPNILHYDEEMNNFLFLLIKNNKEIKSLVIRKGKEAYKEILKTNKQFLFKEYADNHGSNITIGSPDEKWQEKNLQDLRKFYKNLGNERLSKMVQFDSTNDRNKKVEMSLGSAIIKLGETVRDNLGSFVGFIEDGQWSILNKIDTNYSNWGKVIISLDSEGLLGDGSPEKKIDEFFKQRNINTICSPEEINHIKNIENHYNVSIPTLSYAEYKIYKDGEKNYNFIKTNIKKTTESGDLAEAKFMSHLKNNKISDIVDFSSPGNQVDMIFGVDMMVNLPFEEENGKTEYRWTPIQMKSGRPNDLNLKIFDFDFNGIAVWPGIKGDYTYILSPEGQEKSFNLDFLNSK